MQEGLFLHVLSNDRGIYRIQDFLGKGQSRDIRKKDQLKENHDYRRLKCEDQERMCRAGC